MKIMDIYDYHKFLKIKRKYYKRHCVKRVDNINGKKFVSYWEKEDWIGYIIPSYLMYTIDKSTVKEVKSVIGPDLYNDTLGVVKDIYDNTWGKYEFSFMSKDKVEQAYQGFVIGIILTNRDAYFLVSDKQYSKEKKDYQLIPMFWNTRKL